MNWKPPWRSKRLILTLAASSNNQASSTPSALPHWRHGLPLAWQLLFTEQYNRRAARFLRRHTSAKALKLPEADPHHPSLRPHASKGKWPGLHSVSISFSYRSTREWLITKSEVVPINVGSHCEVY